MSDKIPYPKKEKKKTDKQTSKQKNPPYPEMGEISRNLTLTPCPRKTPKKNKMWPADGGISFLWCCIPKSNLICCHFKVRTNSKNTEKALSEGVREAVNVSIRRLRSLFLMVPSQVQQLRQGCHQHRALWRCPPLVCSTPDPDDWTAKAWEWTLGQTEAWKGRSQTL